MAVFAAQSIIGCARGSREVRGGFESFAAPNRSLAQPVRDAAQSIAVTTAARRLRFTFNSRSGFGRLLQNAVPRVRHGAQTSLLVYVIPVIAMAWPPTVVAVGVPVPVRSARAVDRLGKWRAGRAGRTWWHGWHWWARVIARVVPTMARRIARVVPARRAITIVHAARESRRT